MYVCMYVCMYAHMHARTCMIRHQLQLRLLVSVIKYRVQPKLSNIIVLHFVRLSTLFQG